MMVCVGNICRSPMAEALLQDSRPGLNVYSSGIGALAGKPADPIATQLMADKGIDLSKHVAQQINSLLVTKADLILVMENSHINSIRSNYPAARGKVYLIGKWENDMQIADPYKRGEKAFENAMSDIETGLNAWLNKL